VGRGCAVVGIGMWVASGSSEPAGTPAVRLLAGDLGCGLRFRLRGFDRLGGLL
jgi:hypothetical protein